MRELANQWIEGLSNTVLYEGYAIQSSPRYLAEGQKWQFCIVVSFKQYGAMKLRESSSEIFYATEQEADIHGDIHGIAFAQHLIDGKVDGCSVTAMKVEKRLGTRRFCVQFPTMLSDRTKHEGSGLMLDVSLVGCRLESQCGLEWPLVIDGARVQWVRGHLVGLAFVRIRKTEQQGLERVIGDLRIRGADEVL